MGLRNWDWIRFWNWHGIHILDFFGLGYTWQLIVIGSLLFLLARIKDSFVYWDMEVMDFFGMIMDGKYIGLDFWHGLARKVWTAVCLSVLQHSIYLFVTFVPRSSILFGLDCHGIVLRSIRSGVVTFLIRCLFLIYLRVRC